MVETLQIKTSDLISDYQVYTKDSSAANVAKGKRQIQHYYTFLLSESDNYVAEKTRYGNLKANQRSYLLHPDYIKMKTVRFKSGDRYVPGTEVKSLDRWHSIISFTRTVSLVTDWIVINEEGNLHLEVDGIPSDNVTNGIEMIYEGYQDPLYFPDDYTDGTVTATSGSETITGSGTTFTSAMVGRFINIGKWWYEIQSVESTTSLTLVNYYQEDSASGSTYTIAELMKLPPEFHLTPLWAACRDYWRISNAEKAKEFEADYARELLMLQDKYKSKSKGSVTPGRRVGSSQGSVPRNYPTQAITTYN